MLQEWFGAVYNYPEMMYEHDRIGFGKLPVPALRKYTDCKDSILIFVKLKSRIDVKTKVSRTTGFWSLHFNFLWKSTIFDFLP